MSSLFFAAVVLFLCLPTLLGRLCRAEKIFPLVFLQLILGLLLSESGLVAWLKTKNVDLLGGSLSLSLEGLGWLGVVIMIALSGGESMSMPADKRNWRFVPISISGFLFTCILGSVIGYQLAQNFPGVAGGNTTLLRCAFTIGVTLSVTALPVLISILRDTGLAGSRVGNVAVNCAMLDDLWMWLGIALILSFGNQAKHPTMIFLLLSGYLGFMFFVLKPSLHRWYASHSENHDRNAVLIFSSVICFSAMLTGLIGLHSLFGAFIGGVIFPKDVIQKWRGSLLMFSQSLLLPFYFILTGMRLHFDVGQPSFWLLTTIVTVVAVVGKFASVSIAARYTGLPWREAGVLGCLMQCKGLMELIAINIFFDAGIIGSQIYSALAMMALISTLLTAPTMAIVSRTPKPSASRLAGAQAIS